ncbi:MAG: putative metal-binding motif-containing protein [Acidobacteriota bacterium]|nr:putative metal-binding motif-containing protein [Acidobacteriota bacterium]
MSARYLRTGLVSLAGILLALPIRGQVCQDLDADQALAGHQCAEAEDCADRSWTRRPGAAEICDGFDTDCDGTLDQDCDRWCEDPPVLFPQMASLPLSAARPDTSSLCARLTEEGFLVGSTTELYNVSFNRLMSVRSFDRLARPTDAVYELGDPNREDPEDRRCGIADGSDRLLVAWYDETGGGFRLKARVIDRLGRPIAPELDLTATYDDEGGWLGGDPAVAWDGERFAVFWIPRQRQNEIVATFVLPDGGLADPPTVLVSDDLDGEKHFVGSIEVVWTGEDYLLVAKVNFTGFASLVVQPDGTPAAPSIPLGDRGGTTSVHELTLVGGNSAHVWKETVAPASDNLYLDLLDPDGRRIQPTIPLKSNTLRTADIAAAWTGEMLGIATATRDWSSAENDYEATWWFWRIQPDGSQLDNGGVLLSDDTRLESDIELMWSGEEFWIVGKVEDPGKRLVRARVVCSCNDLDNDQADACFGLDCDDTDPAVNPAAAEICRGQVDDDCDGAVDCDDDDCPAGPGPGVIDDLHWQQGSLAWSPVAGAEVYDLARGLIGDLRRRSDFLDSQCAGRDLLASEWIDDGRPPPPGQALWYLARAEGAPCHPGAWSSDGSPRNLPACD